MTDTTHNSLTGTRWQLDPEHSTAEFRVGTLWGLVTVHGRFQQLNGEIEPDGQMELTLEAASLDTRNRQRDRHLRSPDFFDADRHPQVRFRSTGVEQLDNGSLRVVGELHAAGRQVRIELQPVVRQIADSHVELDTETTIDQRQLGMTYRRFGVRTPAMVAVHARLHRAGMGGPGPS